MNSYFFEKYASDRHERMIAAADAARRVAVANGARRRQRRRSA